MNDLFFGCLLKIISPDLKDLEVTVANPEQASGNLQVMPR